jgi:hypothetical protein
VKEADWVALEPLLGRLVALQLRQSQDALRVEAPMQGSTREPLDGRLKGVEAVVQRQERMTSEATIMASCSRLSTVE